MEEEKLRSTEAFYKFFTDLFENHKELVSYYLTDNVVLHWFGHTVKGIADVTLFIKTNLFSCKHHFNLVTSYGYGEMNDNDFAKTQFMPTPSTSLMLCERGQGDGIHNNITCSPVVKRIKLEYESKDRLDDSCELWKTRYLLGEGAVEFQKPSAKKILHDSKWKRPCRLHIAHTPKGNNDYAIHYIIYEGNVKCRRNLLKEFSAEESEY